MNEKDKKYYRDYFKIRRSKLRQEGICLNCTKKPAVVGKTCCQDCLDSKKISSKFGTAKLYKDLYADLFEKQEGKCAICDEYMVRPLMDHCHDTQEVRGLLCARCNTGLGFFKDDQIRISRAVRYLNSSRTGIFFKERKEIYREPREKREYTKETVTPKKERLTKKGYLVID